MSERNFMTSDEMESVKNLVDHLNDAPALEVGFDVKVFDANGEVLGTIEMGPTSTYVFFLGERESE